MDILLAFLIGIIIGSTAAYYLLQQSQQRKITREYESQLQVLKEEHQKELKDARNRSLDGSRAVIKGKIAEQFAPMLPGFNYLPSDARFMGDPIDYIVFNGYTDIKDNSSDKSELEIVILDVKTGQATLSEHQQAIAAAVNAGRVRFEVIRFDIPEEPSLEKQSEPVVSADRKKPMPIKRNKKVST